jgi:hypothetical protein
MSEKWVRQTLTAEFLSDAHLGSGSGGGGIDALVARDRHDRPVIRDARAEGEWAAAKLHMHAEDEFSAGSYDSAKRDAVRVLHCTFPVRIVIEGDGDKPADVERLVKLIDRQVALGALGHLPVGGHKTRGAGAGHWQAKPWVNGDVTKARDWEPPPRPEEAQRSAHSKRSFIDRPAAADAWVRTTTGAITEPLTLGAAAKLAKAALGERLATLSNATGLAAANLKPDDRVFVATTGGLAAANELINELVRLHCVGGPSVTALEVPDGDRAKQDDRAVEEKFHPATGYSARWHALSLVEKGNLLGAWGAVSHLEGAPGQEWTQVIKWLAHFASSLPLPTGCDLAVLSHQRMAVRAALRVELALRAGDIPRAVHGTVAFFEAALWDKLLEHFERDATDIRWLKLRAGSAAPIGKLLREGDDDDKNRPFESKSRPDGQAWFWFHESGAGRFARDYVTSAPLKKLLDAVDKVKALRNDVAHNEPTPNLMNDARTRMRTAALWSNTDTFLSQSLACAVLKELGETEPEKLLVNLLADVRRRLVAPARSAGGPT